MEMVPRYASLLQAKASRRACFQPVWATQQQRAGWAGSEFLAPGLFERTVRQTEAADSSTIPDITKAARHTGVA
ncbi:uncharacterized protein TrAFT101_001019 [Trichoderma asperellum]|uniref:uncharacterized protein n=1 Tax=Trichoderma asperellum TaxID=101201 RepID=UPI003316EDA8|nr:hypothetical protein TrAFT101_001019 [Trichoderma asperellum]